MTTSLTRPVRPAAARARTDTAATRHLCAGVYFDRAYRDLVIRKVHNDPRHRVAPSAGFDLVAVVWHAWRARLLDDAEHLCLLLILAIGYTVNHAAAVTAACLLGLWHLVPFGVRTVPRVTALKAQAATCDLLRDTPGHSNLMEREYTEPPFSAHELVAHLREAVERIRDADGEIRLPGLEVGDRLYIAETEVLTNREYLRAAISPRVLEDIIDHPGGPADHFLEVRVTTTGELVTTVLLRSTVKGRCLSLDFAACALTRTPAGYHLLDHYAETGTGAVLRSALRALAGLPAETGRSWRLALAPWLLACAWWARKDATMIPRRRVWIGTQLSVRKEEDSAPWHHAYADEPKILDHMKIIEQCLISAAEDFLRAHHVDVSAFSKRAETIISANVLNLGGRMDIRNSAFGYQPQANFGSADRGEPSQEGDRS